MRTDIYKIARDTCYKLDSRESRLEFLFKDLHDIDEYNGLEVIDSGVDSEGRDTLFLVYDEVEIILEKNTDIEKWMVLSIDGKETDELL
ncbi:hypothetical protein BCSAG_48590 [Bacillus cereus]